MERNYGYPFSAIVGQEEMKLALLLNVVNPRLGGVLIQGEKGTAKSTAVRGLAALIPQMKVVELPVSATEDRVVGTLNLEKALQEGEKRSGSLRTVIRSSAYGSCRMSIPIS